MTNVYVQSNEADANRLLVFRSRHDGALEQVNAVATGGVGDGRPHLTSQGSVAVAAAGRNVLVANRGSGDVTLFAVGDGVRLVATSATGAAPSSVAEHEGLVYVLNAGEPSLVGFHLNGTLRPIEGSRVELPSDADPAQVGFAPDGETLVVTERGTNAIALYPVHVDGRLGARRELRSAGPTPYGFAFARGTLVVTEAFEAAKGKAAASSYVLHGGDGAVVSRSIGNGRSEICWAVAGNGGHHVFATNFADGAISRYAVRDDGTLALDDPVAAVTVDGRAGLRDEDVTSDGRFLYAIDADAGSLFGWSIAGDGSLRSVGSWNGLPLTIAGLAAS